MALLVLAAVMVAAVTPVLAMLEKASATWVAFMADLAVKLSPLTVTDWPAISAEKLKVEVEARVAPVTNVLVTVVVVDVVVGEAMCAAPWVVEVKTSWLPAPLVAAADE